MSILYVAAARLKSLTDFAFENFGYFWNTVLSTLLITEAQYMPHFLLHEYSSFCKLTRISILLEGNC